MTEHQQYGLVAPTIPAAEFDGLIKVVDLDSDVILHLPVWFGAEALDTFQLLLDGDLVGPLTSMPSPTPEQGSELTLAIPVNTQLKFDGIYRVGYRATNTIGGSSADSEFTNIRVDRTAPGAALLAPLSFPDITLGESLTGLIPGYAYMSTGDVIQSFCNDIEGQSVTVQPEHLTTTPVSIQFDRSFLDYLNSDEVSIGYRVTDRAGNVSIMSQLVTLTLQA